MLTSKPRMPELPSIPDIDRDIVACEVALDALSNGGHVFDPDREGLGRKLSELLELRLQCERRRGTILRFAMREKANPYRLVQPAKGLP